MCWKLVFGVNTYVTLWSSPKLHSAESCDRKERHNSPFQKTLNHQKGFWNCYFKVKNVLNVALIQNKGRLMAHTNSYTCQVQTPDWDMVGTVPKAVITSRQQRLRLQLIPGQLATVVLSTWETSSLHRGSCQSCCDRSCVRVGNHDALVHSGATEKYWQHLLLNDREGRN